MRTHRGFHILTRQGSSAFGFGDRTTENKIGTYCPPVNMELGYVSPRIAGPRSQSGHRACDRDVRAAVRALIVVKRVLEAHLNEVYEVSSKAHTRGGIKRSE
jgi:hypothetical protein